MQNKTRNIQFSIDYLNDTNTKNKKGLDLPEPKLQTKLNFLLIILVVDCSLLLPTTYQDLLMKRFNL